jgi:4-amino-4-deoxy-L-arabinose transferase-like glycosyltransferase
MSADPSSPSQPKLHLRVDLPPGMNLRVTLEATDEKGNRLTFQRVNLKGSENGPQAAEVELVPYVSLYTRLINVWWAHWVMGLFIAALAVYVFTRLCAIGDYPIYFFTDEANQTLLAQDLWRDGLQNAAHDFLPTYFYNVYQYNLGLSVYLQLIPVLLFGRSVEVTRTTAALVTLLAPLWLGLAMLKVYRRPYPWLAALLLAITPAWFLHSRTAFECSLAVTFYAGLLYFYLCYRAGQDRALYGAVLCGALAFYSYSPAQIVVGVTGLLFLLSDWRYHRGKRALLLWATGLGVVCALPYLRFQAQHPGETLNHLNQLGSYLAQPIPWTDKVILFLGNYLQSLSPIYWYGQSPDLVRHTMDGLGHLLVYTFPLGIGGVGLAVWRIRRWEYRLPLLALLAAPSGAALAGVGITRLLFMVVPVTLLSTLLIGEVFDWAARRRAILGPILSGILWGVLVVGNLVLLGSALVYGPTWSTLYGMNGMQWGGRQVFGEVLRYAMQHRGTPIVVSPTWTNGADIVARFFWPDPPPADLAGIDAWLNDKLPLDEKMLFVLPPEEYTRAENSGKFARIEVEKTLLWPNGFPGFYFVHLRYRDDIDEIFHAELVARSILSEAEIKVDNQPAHIRYSQLDMGPIQNIFDGDANTLIRTRSANPLVLQIEFSEPQPLRGLTLRIGGNPSRLEVTAEAEGASQMVHWQRKAEETPILRSLELDFEQILPVRRLEIRLENIDAGEPSHVHLWELEYIR